MNDEWPYTRSRSGQFDDSFAGETPWGETASESVYQGQGEDSCKESTFGVSRRSRRSRHAARAGGRCRRLWPEAEALLAHDPGRTVTHLPYRFVVVHSNWQQVEGAGSETFEVLTGGLQERFREPGGVPREHRTENLSAATHNLRAGRRVEVQPDVSGVPGGLRSGGPPELAWEPTRTGTWKQRTDIARRSRSSDCG